MRESAPTPQPVTTPHTKGYPMALHDDECCGGLIKLRSDFDGHETQFDTYKEDAALWRANHLTSHDKLADEIKEMRRDIKSLSYRPPIWTTAVISLLTFLLGVAVTVAATAVS